MDENSKPVTVSELAIHIGYIKTGLDKIEKRIESIGNKFATQEEFIDLKDEVKDHEISINSILGDRKYFLGALAVLVALQGGIIYFAKMYITNEINSSVEISVQRILSTYNITNESDNQTKHP